MAANITKIIVYPGLSGVGISLPSVGTQGKILYSNGSSWTTLAPGTASQLLITGGAAANPSWSNVPKLGVIAEAVTDAGITLDGVVLKDGGGTFTAAIAGTTLNLLGNATVDSLLTNSNAYITGDLTVESGMFLKTDAIIEDGSGEGVTVEGVLLKDNHVTVGTSGAVFTDIIAEKVDGEGVTIDGVLIKDYDVEVGTGGEIRTDTISEKVGSAGVTIDGVLCKDNVITTESLAVSSTSTFTGIADFTTSLKADTINESTEDEGVTIEGVLCKDTHLTTLGSLAAAAIYSSGDIIGDDIAGATVIATGAMTGATVTASGTVSGATVTASGTVSGATVTATGELIAASKVIFAGVQTVAAGGTSTVLDLTKTVHHIDADAGGDAFTLADGVVGQIQTICMDTSTGTATITPANLAGGTSITLNSAGDTVTLQFVDTQWYIIGRSSDSAGITKKTTTYTALITDRTILCDASGGAFTVTLPAAAGNTGLTLTIKKIEDSSNEITIDGNASETIDLAATLTVAGGSLGSATVQSDGTEWWIL